MRIVGVIAEYNPFHKGHAWHLMKARAEAGADYVVVVMSSVFTQRGDAALLSPADRARMALRCGADAVFALPAAWAVRDAEHFALGGAAILHGLGADAISFGAEEADAALLNRAACMLETQDAQLSSAIEKYLARGLPYPAALASAAGETEPDIAALLQSPNNTLGICYLRALSRLTSGMEVFPIPRTGDYHSAALNQPMPSATALRGAVLRGDWQGAAAGVPEHARNIVLERAVQGRLHRPEALDTALLYQLRTITDAERQALPDLSEGIGDRLFRAAGEAVSREDLLQRAKTRRYPYARLSRLCTHALLHMTQSQLDETPLPPAAWLLGMRKDARPLMNRLSQGTLPIIGKAADYDRSEAWFRTELLAYDVWALGAGLPSGLGLTQGVVIE